METIKPGEFAKDFGFFLEAAERSPVLIDAGSGNPLVVITLDEYHRLEDLDRKVFSVDELPDDVMQAIRDAEAPAEADQYNHEWPGTDSLSEEEYEEEEHGEAQHIAPS